MEIETIQKIQEVAAYVLLYSVMTFIVAACWWKICDVVYQALDEKGATLKMMIFWIVGGNKREDLFVSKLRDVVRELRVEENHKLLKEMEDIFKYN